MYLEDICVCCYRAVWLAVSPFAIITCDYGTNDSLSGWFCPATCHPRVLSVAEPLQCLHWLPHCRESADDVHMFVCAHVCV